VLGSFGALMRPNVRGMMANGTRYRSNSLGIRGPEYSFDPAAGVFRIVVVGDSVTMGVNVEEFDTYSALLEAALNARAGGQRYEVLNVGMAALNIEQVLQRLETIGLRYHPELIVYGWTINDITGSGYRSFKRPQDHSLEQRRRNARFRRSPSYLVQLVWPRWVSLRELLATEPNSYLAELRHNYSENAAAWTTFVGQLDRLAAVGARERVCVVVFLHTLLHHLNIFHPVGSIYDRVAEASRARGLEVVPSFQVFRGKDERALHVSPVDPHPNRAGHELHAQALLAGLDALPPACWRRRAGDATGASVAEP
jgi:lysophospholipase L1-like esterase